ncbi:SDR family oxidoreductase [Novosphingobium album (ex Hu et al. 2023)]|uniref:SDR family oxidoreductase n=1 Tax=Novosphingobium album (ex Hu et al. 2023) TaxID=2930093 RepID=A0ABT0AZI8_9SPHN|nr:SDR family oxidoreductase [Novosphingobium album (ex Hu et al. 2023)]MCJ2178078.1 SDR family oxidoreductase [Novosphingobium album (ex Hu et al. 2023)]
MSERVAAKRILVTGGARGLGAAIARRLAADDAVVFIADIAREEGEALASEIGGYYFDLDVSSEANWISVIAEIETGFGGLDGLVNNAGIATSKGGEDIETIEIEDFNRIFSINVVGTVLGCKHAIPLMARSGPGSIVNLSSIAALIPAAFVVSYGASKATVAHLSRSVAHHCAMRGYGIRCNSLHPGQVRTDMMNGIIERVGRDTNMGTEKAGEVFDGQIPLGCPQEAEDIANGALYLLSDESRYVTGTQLIVDGGMTLSN